MSVTATPGATIYPSLDWGVSGLVGTIGVRIYKDSDGSTALARATAGITETPATSGRYVATLVAPATAAEYTILWDNGIVTVGNTATEDLTVTSSAPSIAAGTDLCSLGSVKAYLQKTDSTFDSVLAEQITAASVAIERYASREFSDKGTLTRTFVVTGSLIDLRPYELRAGTVITLDPAGSPVILTTDQWLATSPTLLGTYLQLATSRYTYLGSARSDSFGSGSVSITGSWGAASTPADVAHAAVQTAALWFRREIAARGSGSDLEFGEDLRPLAIPGAALRLLAPYARTVYA